MRGDRTIENRPRHHRRQERLHERLLEGSRRLFAGCGDLDRLDLGGAVGLLGRRSQEEVAELAAAADLFVLASTVAASRAVPRMLISTAVSVASLRRSISSPVTQIRRSLSS